MATKNPEKQLPERARETLYIRNFCGLKDLRLEFRDINVLIGPQASGKSVIAKLLCYFRDYLTAEQDYSSWLENKDSLDTRNLRPNYEYTKRVLKNIPKKRIADFSRFFPEESWFNSMNDKTEIEYHKDDCSIFVTLDPKKGFKFEDKNTKNIIDPPVSKRHIFVSSGRNLFSNFKKNTFKKLYERQYIDIDPFLIAFGSYYELIINCEGYALEEDIKRKKEFSEPLGRILGGPLIQRGEKFYIQQHDGHRVALLNLSSGQQELLPLAILVDAWQDDTDYYIEEPEAHLFPSAQRAVVESLTAAYMRAGQSSGLLVTTHSPLILSAFNNYIKAGYISETKPQLRSQLEKILPQDLHIPPEKFMAYEIADGEAKSIIDSETKLVLAEELNGISNEIGSQFDQLLDLE